MYFQNAVFWLVFILYWCDGTCNEAQFHYDDSKYTAGSRENIRSTYSVLSDTIAQAVKEKPHDTCNSEDYSCLAMMSSDKHGLEAIRELHKQLDDDENGNVDLSETGDFLRQDLKIDSGYEKRQQVFHQNDDMHISVKELWEAWLRSEVHNWTIEQTVEWLTTNVGLSQYATNFIHHKVTGAALPRLAVNNMNYLSMLGIKDPIHKQKISLKAMDVVLFGPPKDGRHHWKDLVLIILVIGGGIGFWYGYQQNKKFKLHVNRMCRDMEGLQNAELTLEKLQKELEQARLAEKTVASEKENLEKRLQESEADSTTLQHSISDGEVSQLKAEIEMLRSELQIAESKLHGRCWNAPPGLQQWLQLTHEIENKAYVKKKLSAEKQLQQAREACEKLRKKRSSLVGAFVSTHGKSIDDVDRTIVEARTSLNEVTQELQERVHRWKQVEYLCGFNIIQNVGLQALENSLYRGLNGRPFGLLKGRISSQDDLDDDTSSIYTPSTGHVESWAAHTWKEADSSGSEASKQEEEVEIRSPPGSVNFLVGGEVSNWTEEPVPIVSKHTRVVSQPPTFRSSSNTNILNNNKSSNMVRSYSQDVNIGATDVCMPNTKSSYSDTSLDYMDKRKSKKLQHKHQTIREQPSASTEDICSTDSSVVDEDPKRKKKKFFSFGKKTMEKAD